MIAKPIANGWRVIVRDRDGNEYKGEARSMMQAWRLAEAKRRAATERTTREVWAS